MNDANNSTALNNLLLSLGAAGFVRIDRFLTHNIYALFTKDAFTGEIYMTLEVSFRENDLTVFTVRNVLTDETFTETADSLEAFLAAKAAA